jgi:hypothetical protein
LQSLNLILVQTFIKFTQQVLTHLCYIHYFIITSIMNHTDGFKTSSTSGAYGQMGASQLVMQSKDAGFSATLVSASLEITQPGGNLGKVEATAITSQSTANNTVMTPTAFTFTSDPLGTPVSVALSSADGLKITSGPFQPDELLDVSGNNGLDGQYLISNGTAPVWTTVSAPATPNLASVLAVATAGDADNQPISNLSSLGFEATTGGQAVLALTAKASSKPAATFDVLNLPYAADATTGRVFSNQYVEISVAGTSYWVQLFSAPPV